MKVAAVQFAPVFKDPKANIQQGLKLVSEAAQQGARLVVLPELCTTGYSFMSVEEAEPYAEIFSQKDPRGAQALVEPPLPNAPHSFTMFRLLSKSLKVAIAWGVMEKDPGTGKLHNAQAIVLPNGRWVSYRKVNLWGNDFIWATEGAGSPPILEFEDKKIGLLICRDVRDKAPAWEELYEPGDADIVAFSSNWGDGGFPSVNWVKFAKENQVFLVVGNRYGQEGPNNFGEGGVCVIEPCGKIHCQGLIWNKPCIVYADVP